MRPLTSMRALTGLAFAALAFLAASGKAQSRPERYRIDRGTVYDAKTKLTWQQAVPSSSHPWAEAMRYCKELDLDGKGWRLPSVNELQTLVDETRFGPAIDPVAFPSTPVAYFWTSSNLAGFPNFGWTIYFAYGFANFFDVVQPHQVRCVR
jgi:hypothetical protein